VDGRTQYANFSSWDTYKGQNQMLALMQPRRYREMLLSLLATAREAGKLPRWGEQNIDAAHMSGDPTIPMLADGLCRGLLDEGSAGAAYDAAVDLTGRRAPELAQLGYLPGRAGTTLEYGVADFALALMAEGLDQPSDARRWLAQSLVYRNLLDPETRWIRPRDATGAWRSPFQPTDEDGFQEGNSWQYSWLAPHDARGLFDRMGGDAAAIDRLDTLFAGPPDVQSAATAFGTQYKTNQYAPGNEHDLQVPWMYAFARRPWRGAAELREIQGVFRPTPDGLPGNDDLGSLSAWHVMSALGFGPVTPGAPFYVIGSPEFEGVTVDPAGRGVPFRIEAPGASLTNKYVQAAQLGGRPLTRAWFDETALRRGETLSLLMGSDPSPGWATNAEAVPPSVTGSSLRGFGCSRGVAAGNAANPSGTGAAGSRSASGRQPRVRLLVSPRRLRVGRARVLRVQTKVGRRALAGAIVTVGHRRARTRRDGRASFRVLPRRAGLMRLRATKRGMRTARVAVRVVRHEAAQR
jgi:predicted alpha-1,2-mannosidase